MKSILLTTIAAAGLCIPAAVADYTVFRVCEEERVIKTSDGADAGRVEYIVVDPSQQRVVSAVISGGVISNKHVAVQARLRMVLLRLSCADHAQVAHLLL
ncbi:MAG: PRC-barrel domain containing protein [Verrucomicrobiaceae bacterium]|nr:MAG: PRC-barrel domain containing protein [Verrucomicrobiaceae bacterium]